LAPFEGEVVAVARVILNFPTKSEWDAFVRSERRDEISRQPFGYVFDPDELGRLYNEVYG